MYINSNHLFKHITISSREQICNTYLKKQHSITWLVLVHYIRKRWSIFYDKTRVSHIIRSFINTLHNQTKTYNIEENRPNKNDQFSYKKMMFVVMIIVLPIVASNLQQK